MEVRSRWALALLLAAVAPGASCLPQPAAVPARGSTPLSPEVVRAYRPQDRPFGLSFEPMGRPARDHEVLLFRFQRFSEATGDYRTVEGRYYKLRGLDGEARRPLLLQCPILAGAVDDYLACKMFASWAASEGIASFFLHQEEDILTAGRDALDLERTTEESIRDNIAALDLLAALPEVDPDRLALLGISLGALRGVPLAAVEPRLGAVVLCLGGADIPQILKDSRENGVTVYLDRRRRAANLAPAAVAADFARYFRSDPLRFAGALDPRTVLLFLGSFDDKVPFDQGLQLRDGLGVPRTYVWPVGHYTGIPLAPLVALRTFEFLRRRWQGAGAEPR